MRVKLLATSSLLCATVQPVPYIQLLCAERGTEADCMGGAARGDLVRWLRCFLYPYVMRYSGLALTISRHTPWFQ